MTSPLTPHRYFVSYAHRHGFGCGRIDLALPIRGMDDVGVLIKTLRDHDPNLASVVVLFWRPFEQEG